KPVPARSILNGSWIKANIESPDSRLNRLLEANGMVGAQVKPWTPPCPVFLAHDPYDRTVSFSNTADVFESWKQNKAEPLEIFRMEARDRGPGHAGGAVIAIPAAFIWIAAGMPDSVWSMAKDKILAAIQAAVPERHLDS